MKSKTSYGRRHSIQTPLTISNHLKKEFPHLKTSTNDEIQISYSSKLHQNEKHNPYMEDIQLTIPNFVNDKHQYLFGIFDGHGGDSSAKMTKDFLPKFLQKSIKENPINIEHCMELSFKKIEQKAKESNFILVGNTATIILINTHNHIIYCGNVGDSSCMIVNNEHAFKISYDDKCSDDNEKKRIEKEGGCIINNRLNNVLAITRSIGDFDQKGKGLIAIPHIHKHTIVKKDKFLVVASDGIWDVVNQDILFDISIGILNNSSIENKSDALVNKLVDYAVENGSMDNISCIVVHFE